ncbi:MAG: membrane-bound lytic murein transglycosylase MltF [Alteromonadaceae bacterium]|nr:membrane-bound lytic murein transglycosylase MltF [Alteromonadaceae bacterium]
MIIRIVRRQRELPLSSRTGHRATPGLALAVILLAAAMLSGCSRPSTLQEIRNEGVLHVITREAPSLYYQQRGDYTGYDYQLARHLADHLGVELRVRVAEDNSEILSVLANNYAHIGLAGMTDHTDLSDRFRTLPTGIRAQSVIVYNRDAEAASSLDELSGNTIHMLPDSSHQHLIDQTGDTAPSIQMHPGLDAAGLLARVDRGEFTYAAIASNELELNQVFYPNVMEGFSLSNPRDLVWLFPAEQDNTLINTVEDFFEKARNNGLVAQLRERFYGHLEQLNYVGALTFMKHVKERLHRYEPLFREYARETGFDWRLLAAIGYQESHWRPNAVSPTGVRGLMMLTLSTARHVGISNRLNPEQSIEGGARYFRRVYRKIPERIPEPDRTWFALASYNVGFGHLEDARRLTEGAGQDPDRWMDVKEFLPLLAQKEWYSKTRYGYARGHEPVLYVQNIRRYLDFLVRLTEPEMPVGTETEQQLVWLEPQEGETPQDRSAEAAGNPPERAALPPEIGPIPPTL